MRLKAKMNSADKNKTILASFPHSFLSLAVWKSNFSFMHRESLGMRLQNYRELGGVWGARLLRNKSFGLEEANFNAKVRTACWTYGWSAQEFKIVQNHKNVDL